MARATLEIERNRNAAAARTSIWNVLSPLAKKFEHHVAAERHAGEPDRNVGGLSEITRSSAKARSLVSPE